VRSLALTVLCLVVVPAGVFAWAASSRSGGDWTVAGVRSELAAQGFQHVSTPAVSGLHAKTAAERRQFQQVRGLVFGQSRAGVAIMFVMKDDASARELYRLAQHEGANFRGGRLKGAAVRNVLIDYIRPAQGPDRFNALVAALSR